MSAFREPSIEEELEETYARKASLIVRALDVEEYAYMRAVTNVRLGAIIAKRVAKHAADDELPPAA